MIRACLRLPLLLPRSARARPITRYGLSPLILASIWYAAAVGPAGRTSHLREMHRAPLAGRAAGSAIVLDTVPSPALTGNLYGDPARVPIAVYLPPHYARSGARRYPVLYVLHGFPYTLAGQPVPDAHTRWLASPFGAAAIDSLFAAGALRELLVVVPQVQSRFGAGSFYTNSAAAGGWETFVARDLVRYVDRHYRTLRREVSRGIAGGSGGGYGALRLALRHPDTFGAVYAQSPCCLATAAFEYDEAAWHAALGLRHPGQLPDTTHPATNVLVGLGAAWSPDPLRPPFYLDWPFELRDGRRVPREPAYAQWQANTVLGMLPHYVGNLRRLHAIAFDVGREDQYRFIPPTVRALSRELTRRGIRHQVEEYDGDHASRRGERMVTRVLPFFSGTLKFD
jgi:S-formylglutathione hydrolase